MKARVHNPHSVLLMKDCTVLREGVESLGCKGRVMTSTLLMRFLRISLATTTTEYLIVRSPQVCLPGIQMFYKGRSPGTTVLCVVKGTMTG